MRGLVRIGTKLAISPGHYCCCRFSKTLWCKTLSDSAHNFVVQAFRKGLAWELLFGSNYGWLWSHLKRCIVDGSLTWRAVDASTWLFQQESSQTSQVTVASLRVVFQVNRLEAEWPCLRAWGATCSHFQHLLSITTSHWYQPIFKGKGNRPYLSMEKVLGNLQTCLKISTNLSQLFMERNHFLHSVMLNHGTMTFSPLALTIPIK